MMILQGEMAPQTENFGILGPQTDDFTKGNGPPQAENFGILGSQNDDFTRGNSPPQAKFFGIWTSNLGGIRLIPPDFWEELS